MILKMNNEYIEIRYIGAKKYLSAHSNEHSPAVQTFKNNFIKIQEIIIVGIKIILMFFTFLLFSFFMVCFGVIIFLIFLYIGVCCFLKYFFWSMCAAIFNIVKNININKKYSISIARLIIIPKPITQIKIKIVNDNVVFLFLII